MNSKNRAIDFIINQLLKGRSNIKAIKLEAAHRFSLDYVIKNSEVLRRAKELKLKREIMNSLLKKPVRTISGVSPIAIMIKPFGSCRWDCAYCPTSKKGPKSYSGEEPAALRARSVKFDPIAQVKTRLQQYSSTGHPIDKCELIIMGGTFFAMQRRYKRWFVKSAYDAMNGKTSKSLSEAKKYNEKGRHRVVGLTIETRPDVCGENEIDEMLDYGATRVELGVQHPNDEIYRIINRSHNVEDVIRATRLLKNSGFKVLYHIMPGLPRSNKQKDIRMLKQLFEDERFRPDMLKIYPTLVLKGTILYEIMKQGNYNQYSTNEAVDVISEFYRYIPQYVRVMRIQRDIPAGLIYAGVKNSNLRELVEKEVKRKKIKINEIRLREIGMRTIKKGGGYKKFDNSEYSINSLKYTASGGVELFISFEQKADLFKTIAGFARVRIPEESHRKEITNKSAILRELRVLGQEAEIDGTGIIQHKGIGSTLLSEAERIAKEEFDRKNMVVISGVGVKEYYYKRGYSFKGPYVAKDCL